MDRDFKKYVNQGVPVKKIIEDVFIETCHKLNHESNVDTKFSGSTCVTVFYTPQKLMCANVGDSRAIVGRLENGVWTHHALSRDQKPCDKDEMKRIIECGGRVEPMKGKLSLTTKLKI